MAAAGGANMEQFETFFQRADLDRDGRISGAEAVSFFKGANLPQQVLAQIWAYADQNQSGFLSRPSFYNALKLVTVAQSKRQLTPDIVKAALHGPASAKIPAPQINLAAISTPQPNPVASAPSPQMSSALPSSQNFGFQGQSPVNNVNQQFRPPISSPGVNQHLRQGQPLGTGFNQQYGQVVQPYSAGINQQFRPHQPTSQGQQFGQIQPPSTNVTSYYGQVQPSSTGMNQQFGQAPVGTNMNQQFIPSQGNQSVRPPLPAQSPASSPLQSAGGPNIPSGDSQLGAGFPNSKNQTSPASFAPATQHLNRGDSPSIQPAAQNPLDQFSAFPKTASQDPKGSVSSIHRTSSDPVTLHLNRGDSPSVQPAVQNPLDQFSAFSKTGAQDPKGSVNSMHRSSSDPVFGGNTLSANQSQSQQGSSPQQYPASSSLASSGIVPGTSAPPSSKHDPFEALRRTIVQPSIGVQASQPSTLPTNQQTPTQITASFSSSGGPASVGSPITEQPQNPWPKMTRASIQKYTKVFTEVDTDRDGKITGEQARNLFLSWGLPIVVLKQVWDLSDQDSDSMLSVREFCVALYLMEQYRGGRPLPSVLPNSVLHDETLLSLAGPPTGYGSMGWGPTTGFRPQQGFQGVQPTGLRPLVPPTASQADGSMHINQQNARSLAVEDDYSVDIKGEEAAAEANDKVETTAKVLLDSREKLEFYRTKMQDLVLYKSRCENRLNEITERARADKTEAELLEKKYQEKYKQVAEIHSKLTIEEASFREMQERKMELRQAIIKMEQGGSADGILQVRADRIQTDLEELLKALTDRCNKQSMEMKASTLIELPQGWTPGIPEVAAIWDEDWDKFEDEGFSFDTAVPQNGKLTSAPTEHSSPAHSPSPDAASEADASSEKPFGTGASALETESLYSADDIKSPQESPRKETSFESPTKEYSEKHFRKSSDEDAETHRSFDESAWGNFDNNDDIDSVWGFNAKESDHTKHEEKYFFDSNDFGATSSRIDSPHAQKNNSFIFEDSVPATPQSRFSYSPPARYSFESRDPFFDSFSRTDSFSARGRSSSPPRGSHARYDSISSTAGHTRFDSISGGHARFDSISSTGGHARFDSISSTAGHVRFDSISSTTGFDQSRKFSFDDSDPFGSGPFRVSSETQKKGSEWSNF